MCWNKEISIITFVLAMFGAIYLYTRNGPNDRWIAVFGATIGMIQLAEYFMWLDPTCTNINNINKYASIFAVLILAAEPVMNMVGGIYFSNTPFKSILKWMLLAYIIFIIFAYSSQVHKRNINWCAKPGCAPDSNIFAGFINSDKCNLEWYFTKNINTKIGIIWILFLVLPFLAMTPQTHGIILFTLGFMTLTISSLINRAASGSLWCWLAIGIIYGKILIR